MKLKQYLTMTALIALLSACGAPDAAKNKRSSGTSDDGLDPRKVRSEDATVNQGKNGKTDGEDPGAADGKTDDAEEEKPVDDKDIPVNEVIVKAGLRNYEQINATMSTLTGVPRTNATVRAEFVNNLSSSLPTDNDIRAFLGSQQVAVFKLAVEYCDALVKDTANRGKVFGSFNFGATPAVAFDSAGKAALADALVTNLWGKDLASLPPHGESTDMVVGLIDQLLVGKNLNTVAVTPAVATAVCTATLASAPVTMF